MYQGYKIIAVTPAGRKRFLDILLRHSLQNRDIIDEHHLWINTLNQDDIEYMRYISFQYRDYIKLVPSKMPIAARNAESIFPFFRDCVNENTIYIRFDDDICYICPDAIDNLLSCRLKNPSNFIVYPLIVNNGMEWILKVFEPVKTWKQGNNAVLEHIRRHVEFLSDICSSRYCCEDFIVPYDYLVSINCICWFGSDFAKFNGEIALDEEYDIAIRKPNFFGKQNLICGNALVVHFSYSHGNTCSIIEEFTDLRQRYEELAPEFPQVKNFL